MNSRILLDEILSKDSKKHCSGRNFKDFDTHVPNFERFDGESNPYLPLKPEV